ncbi:MAG: class I SAM-dependent methyltransferase [Desulfurococcaceae archaeon]
MSKSEYMEKLYKLYPWAEDPSTTEGLKRYKDAVSELEVVTKHKWFKELIDWRRELKVIDLCSGTGIGGIALAKVLVNLGIRISLTLVDLRREALNKAVEFCLRELGFKPETLVCDVLEEVELGAKFDVSLIWGYTTPHFSPWDWIKVLANVSQLLVSDGLFLYDELDRVYAIYYFTGYKDLLPELVERDRVVLTIHKDKDFRSGYTTRLVLNLTAGESEEMEIYFWDLASSAAFTWIFFSDVDYIPIRRPYSGIIVAKNPRCMPNLEILLKEKPLMLIHE